VFYKSNYQSKMVGLTVLELMGQLTIADMENLTAALQELQASQQMVMADITVVRTGQAKMEANQEEIKAKVTANQEKTEATISSTRSELEETIKIGWRKFLRLSTDRPRSSARNST
jgi:hypothetical protein